MPNHILINDELSRHSPERTLLALPQRKQHRECSVRLLAARQLPDVPVLGGVVAGGVLVREAQRLVVYVEQKLPDVVVRSRHVRLYSDVIL